MPVFEFYSIRAQDFTALGERVGAMIEDQDLDGWRKVHEQLQFVHSPPHVSGHGTIIAYAEPVTACSQQGWGPGPNLDADALPDPRSIGWVLRELAIMSATHRLIGTWDKFNKDFTRWLPHAGLLETDAERSAFSAFLEAIFAPRTPYVAELAFLQHPDGANAFVTVEQIAELVELEDRVALIDRLVGRLQRQEDKVWRHFATELRRLEHFLRLMKLSGLPMFYSELHT
jgi:hypothetical protein